MIVDSDLLFMGPPCSLCLCVHLLTCTRS